MCTDKNKYEKMNNHTKLTIVKRKKTNNKELVKI